MTGSDVSFRLKKGTASRELHFTPELEKKLNDLAALSGRPADELVQDAVAGLVDELAGTRAMLDGRFDDLKSGRVQPSREKPSLKPCGSAKMNF